MAVAVAAAVAVAVVVVIPTPLRLQQPTVVLGWRGNACQVSHCACAKLPYTWGGDMDNGDGLNMR